MTLKHLALIRVGGLACALAGLSVGLAADAKPIGIALVLIGGVAMLASIALARCPHCRKLLPYVVKYCWHCGKKIPGNEGSANDEPGPRRPS